MEGRTPARIAAIVFVAIAMTAAALHLARWDQAAPGPSWEPDLIETPSSDPLREQLARCQEMGEAASNDGDCLAAWARNRRRFLGQDQER